MTNKCLVTALTLGLLAFTFSILPVSPGNTEPSVVEKRAACVEKGYRWNSVNERCIKPMGRKRSSPCLNGYWYDAQNNKCELPYQDKNIIFF